MKILLSVFECNPYAGSDCYIGWAYAVNLAKCHEVFALTRAENREDIERFLSENEVDGKEKLNFYYVERSGLFAQTLYRMNRYLGFLGSYFVWQYAAYQKAKEICSEYEIDVCHHVSIADFRCAGYLWKCGKPFVYGPVGGGQETPRCLWSYVEGHKKAELFRSFMNMLTIRFPGYKKALQHAAVVYSSNDETTEVMASRMKEKDRKKLEQLTELCIEEKYLIDREMLPKNMAQTVHIVVSGRLIYRKGVALLLDALKLVGTEVPFVVDIFGDGSERENLARHAEKNGLADKVHFHGKVSYEKMQDCYKAADIYVLPSLRETTGTAVIEAMANKLPVIALNQNGVKHLVEQDAGILVNIQSKEQVLKDFADALKKLIENSELRIRLGENGYQKIREQYTWSRRVDRMTEVYCRITKKEELV